MRYRLLTLLLCLLLLPAHALADDGPRGKVAYIWQAHLWTYDLATGERRMIPESGRISDPQWSASGRYLTIRLNDAYTGLWDATGRFRRPLPRSDSNPAWAPNSDRIATWAPGGKLQVQRPKGGIVRTIRVKDEVHPEPPLWSPHGTRLAWVEGNGEETARVMSASATFGKPRQLYSTSGPSGHACLYLAGWQTARSILLWPEPVCSASIAADGLELATLSTRDGSLRPLQVTTLLHPPAISPAGRAAITAGSGRFSTRQKRILVIEPDGEVSPPISSADQAAIQPAWAPDGKRLAWSGGPDEPTITEDWRKGLRERRIWVAPLAGSPVAVTNDPAYQDEAPVWTADGDHLLFVRLDAQDRASLWLLNPQSRTVTKLADLDAGPAGEYYGWREWERVFAYWGP